ncbi:biliverdin-producing heme oxygenase [Alteromonas sp. M12]|uniref:biliverdin-producing heme oxygenase n=1 Tax=Alteromonas sp. M12 TaxID=3135644 RepID=UPI00319E9CAE
MNNRINNPSMDIGVFVKTETAELHRSVESDLSRFLFHRNLSCNTYLQILQAFYASYVAMENVLRDYPETNELIAGRSKLQWLQNDIEYLSSQLQTIPAIVNQNIEIVASSSAEAMGMLYVMEGATLGGAHIELRLNKHDWLSESAGLSFFKSYGDFRLAKWREFSEALKMFHQQNVLSELDIQKGAQKAFHCIQSCLRGALNE